MSSESLSVQHTDYDWVVVGESIGALLSGALAARLGLRVLLVSGDLTQPNPCIARSKLEEREGPWCSGPFYGERLSFLELGEGGLLQDLLLKVGGPLSQSGASKEMESYLSENVNDSHAWIEGEITRMAVGLELSEQVWEIERVAGQARDLQDDLAELKGESFIRALRAFPESLQLSQETLEKVAPRTQEIREPLQISEWIQEARKRVEFVKDMLVRSPKAQKLAPLGAQENRQIREPRYAGPKWQEIWGGLTEWVFGPLARERRVHGWDSRVWPIPILIQLGERRRQWKGGQSALRGMLKFLARKHGALVLEDRKCSRIFFREGRIQGLLITGQGKMTTTLGLGFGEAPQELKRLLVEDPESLKALGLVESRDPKVQRVPRQRARVFSLEILMREEDVEAGPQVNEVKIGGAEPQALEILVLDPVHFRATPPGYRVILARTWLVTEGPHSVSPERLRVLAARMFESVTQVFPRIEERMVRLFPDFRDEDHFFGVLRSLAWNPSDSQLLEPLSQYRWLEGARGEATSLEGFSWVHEDSYPQWGDLSSVLAGLEALARVAHKRGLRGPL